ncbi:MAG TPA: efflux RND transporter permease subunit [Treponemataceae bacterium]|nr:efflux RND transporter permease subunit [Treponemataceae bacterium]
MLVPSSKRKRRVQDIILHIQEVVSAQIPDATVRVSNGGFDKLVSFVSGGGYGINLTGENIEQLYTTAKEIEDFLANDTDIVTTSIDTSFDISTMVIDMSHEYMSSLGITSYEAGITSSILFQGVDAGRFKGIDGSRYNIRLKSDIAGKPITRDDIANIYIVSSDGRKVSFATISTIKVTESISQINRKNRAKTISVFGSLAVEDTTGVSNRMQEYLEKNPLPAGINSEEGGMMELLGDSISPMLIALLIAWFLVYTVMVIQFERFRQPFIIMATIPFCIIGVVIGLLIFGSTMNLVAMLGIISLSGIVVNNGIILIDYMNLLRSQREGKNKSKNENITILEQSVIEGAASRLKPIFMTTLTTMLGVVPMAFSTAEGSEMYAPLGQAIAGGLLTSTIITLFIIPILYFVSERIRILKGTDTQEALNEKQKN